MRKLIAIFFSLILIFNFYGYRIVIPFLQENSQVVVEKMVDDNHYNEADLISIKTAIQLPYYNNSLEYERVYGSINIDGIDYEYVKRRIHNDTLELLCLPNHAKTNLKQVSNNFNRSLSESSSTTPNKKSVADLKVSLPDYSFSFKDFFLLNAAISAKKHSSFQLHPTKEDYSCTQERPPQS